MDKNNDLIDDLYKQARLDAGHEKGFEATVQDVYQKFAQLIVKECLEACSRANEIRHFVPPTQQQVVLSCMDEIERTFRS